MTILSGKDLDFAIRRIVTGSDVRCAVAFWGRGASAFFSKHQPATIICNLAAGGTNPYEIETLLADGHAVRQNDRLHAKVYLSADEAVIASANMSANGLGFEAEEIGHWVEAGIAITDIKATVSWFDCLLQHHETRPVGADDIRRAKVLWKRRQSWKPSLSSFADFDVRSLELPLISWWSPTGKLTVNAKSVRKQTGLEDQAAHDAIEDSVEVNNAEERERLSRGTSILWWRRNADGLPSKTAGLHWFRCGTLIGNAFKYEGDGTWRDTVLNDLDGGPVPFDSDEEGLVEAFRQVMSQPRFKALRDDDSLPYSASKIELMRQFWHDLKDAYLETTSGRNSSSEVP